MSDKVKSVLLNAKNYNKSDEEILHLLVRELQYVGGRTLANTIPRNGIKYAEIVDDVAKKFKIKCPKWLYIYIYLAKSFNANRPCSTTIAVLSDASNCASLNASSPIFSNCLANNLDLAKMSVAGERL
ncbi:TPA: hypothetical protein ACPFK7_000837 [Proteus mirabilis]